MRAAAATGTDRYDLDSGLVVPALADAHVHLGELTRAQEAFDAGPARSIRDLQDRLAGWAERRPGLGVVGSGLVLDRLAERRWPTARELDEVVKDRAAILFHASGHAAVANTAALDQAYGEGPPPAGVDRATGVVVEDALRALASIVDEAHPLRPEALESTLRALLRSGLTAVGTMNPGPEEVALLRKLGEERRLQLRVRAYVPVGSGAGAARGRPGTRFAVAGVKAFLDGAFGPRTAALSEPYADDRSTVGVERGEDRVLLARLERARDHGLAPALHAIGDRAVRRAARLLSALSPRPALSRIEHLGLTPPELWPSLREAGPFLVVQPDFVRSDLWLRDRLGPYRIPWAYAFRSLADLGLVLAGSSDAPYGAADPWRGMDAAVRRQDGLGRSANPWPGQALTETEALALYVAGAHRALGDADRGSLEPDAVADLVVLAVPRLTLAMQAGSSVVRETWVEGRPTGPSVSGGASPRADQTAR